MATMFLKLERPATTGYNQAEVLGPFLAVKVKIIDGDTVVMGDNEVVLRQENPGLYWYREEDFENRRQPVSAFVFRTGV